MPKQMQISPTLFYRPVQRRLKCAEMGRICVPRTLTAFTAREIIDVLQSVLAKSPDWDFHQYLSEYVSRTQRIGGQLEEAGLVEEATLLFTDRSRADPGVQIEDFLAIEDRLGFMHGLFIAYLSRIPDVALVSKELLGATYEGKKEKMLFIGRSTRPFFIAVRVLCRLWGMKRSLLLLDVPRFGKETSVEGMKKYLRKRGVKKGDRIILVDDCVNNGSTLRCVEALICDITGVTPLYILAGERNCMEGYPHPLWIEGYDSLTGKRMVGFPRIENRIAGGILVRAIVDFAQMHAEELAK